jgi:hypothetical protein
VSGRDFAFSDKRGTWQNVAAGFSLRLHRLKACATKQFSYEDGIHQDTKDIMSRHVGWARPTFINCFNIHHVEFMGQRPCLPAQLPYRTVLSFQVYFLIPLSFN